MLSSASYCLRHSRRRPLAASAIALFAVSTTSAWAVPPAVTNCNDSGTGSLRNAVAGAASGDTIDMSGLTPSDPGCGGGVVSTITLTTGAIAVAQKDLTLIGPGLSAGGDYALTITQTAPNSRVILHSYGGSTGHLYVEKVRIGYASISGPNNVYGGCIASLYGAVTLTNVHVDHCSATTTALSTDVPTPHVFGGGVFAATGLTITGGVLYQNAVTATHVGVRSQGGCAMTFGPFNMTGTIVANCYANGPVGGGRVRGGALELKGSSAIITSSVIAKSKSTWIVGGVDINNATGSLQTATISNSTIAYNYAHYVVGGLYANAGQFSLNNSTIVLNQAGQYTYSFNAHTYYAAPGVSIYSIGGTVFLQSNIIANNTANGTQEDLSVGISTGLTGDASNNLVRAYKSDVTLPGGQGNLPKGTCPLLGHARNNGGGTYTFAPQSGSPVIDAGNNNANDPHTGVPALYDQRGPGYPRVSNGIADVGAHEVQKTDIVFYTEFETGCP